MHHDDLRALVDAGHDAAIDLRRDLHAHPELSLDERRTTQVLRERLREAGLRELECPTPTGAVAVLEGGRPGRTVLLRADIDALPVQEEVDVPFRSLNDGVMHACGHDAHAAIAVAVASALARRAEDLPGRLAVVMQPAEELGVGARAMLEGGLLDLVRPDAALGLHVTSLGPTGLVAYRPGVAMAAARYFRIDLHGAGGHAAMSGEDGNVVAAAATLTTRLREVVDGLEYEQTPCVCAAGVLRAGARVNVVPREARIEGTVRSFTDAQHEETRRRLHDLAAAVARSYGVRVAVTEPAFVPPVVNDAGVTAVVAAAARQVVGDGVVEVPPFTPSDDVAELLLRVPGVYLTLGARPGISLPPQHHAPDFAIDEEALRVGALVLAAGVIALARS